MDTALLLKRRRPEAMKTLSIIARLWLRLRLRASEIHRTTELQALLFWAGVVGFAGGMSSVAFRHSIRALQWLMTKHAGSLVAVAASLPPWERLLVPTIGGLAAGLVLQYGLKLTRHIPFNDYMEAIVLGDGVVRGRPTLVKCGSSLLSIASGGSIGREGPMVQLASMLASLVGRFLKASPPRRRLLTACGAAAGIASAYNAPIAGALFVAEIVLGSIAMESFGPLVFASVVATVTVQTFFSAQPIFQVPTFRLMSGCELFLFLGLGVIAGCFAPVMLRLLDLAKGAFAKWNMPTWMKLTAGGFVVGLISVYTPAVWGNGYSVVSSILQQHWVWEALVVVLLCKLFATAACFGSGAVGGLFTPTLFVGAVLGCLFGKPVHALFPAATAGPNAYALVGMGAFLAATTHAPLMAILMMFEMTLDYAIAMPLMVACVTAYYTARTFSKRSVYTHALETDRLERRRFSLADSRVRELLKLDPQVVHPKASFTDICQAFHNSSHNKLYVVDAEQRFLGVIPLEAIRPHIDNPDLALLVIAQDLVDESFPVTTADSSMADALELFSRRMCERLPVVDNPQHRRLLGTISKTDMLLALAGSARDAAPTFSPA
jgi:chloride channel protein, CIC family